MSPKRPDAFTRSFLTLWAGQSLSLVGSALTTFALSFWIFRNSQSVTGFAFALMLAELPGILFAPMAGALVDRHSRRSVMLVADLGSAVVSALALAVAVFGTFELWHAYLLTIASGLATSLHLPAFNAAVASIVPKDQLARAGGMTEISNAAGQLLAPFLGGLLLASVGLPAILLIDLVSFGAGLLSVWWVHIPPIERDPLVQIERPSLWREAVAGWGFLRRQRSLRGLLLYTTWIGFLIAMVMALGPPLFLSHYSPALSGTLFSLGGFGMLAGSLFMATWGGPKRLIFGTFGAQILIGASLVLYVFPPSPWLFGAGLFLFLLGNPFFNASTQAIWLRRVPSPLQGRVFATRRLLSRSCLPLAYLAAGLLADFVFTPALKEHGWLAPTLGRLVGLGPGRGIALLFALLGVAIVLSTLLAFSSHVRKVEDEHDEDATPASDSLPVA